MSIPTQRRTLACLLLLALALAACAIRGSESVPRHLWWSGLGPVLPHDSFPADCSLCHVANEWQTLKPEFAYDHLQETGYALRGAHARAQCLRCHNDRGPAGTFASQGCGGCHADVHRGGFANECTRCHQETSWEPVGMFELHQHTRFPLAGAHAAAACWRCHPGGEVGKFVPADPECSSCHRSDLARATNPNHAGLGWVDHCGRCHVPRTWQQAEIH